MAQIQQVKIAVVDDHKLFREGLIRLINGMGENKYFIMLEAANGKELIARLDRKALPDLIIMDIEMKLMGGFETVAWLRSHHPEINILVISMVVGEDAIIRMLKLGVKGYLSKDIETEELAAALRAITSKGYYYTDFITGKLIHSLQSSGEGEFTSGEFMRPGIWHQLTEREREFIRIACSELTYDEIAREMFVSPKTVEGYRDSVFKKMNVKNRVGMVLSAIRNKLFTI